MRFETDKAQWYGDASRLDDVRRNNRRQVIACIRAVGPISRTEIGEHTGLSPAALTTISAEMINQGILMEQRAADTSTQRRGRPKTELALNPAAASVLSVNIQLNEISAQIADYRGNPLSQATLSVDTRHASRRKIREDVVRCIKEARATMVDDTPPIRQACAAVQGVTDAVTGYLKWSPITPHLELRVPNWIEKAADAPAHVMNDANLAALALHTENASRYGDTFAAVLLAHGVGMGLFLRGIPLEGTMSSGGEFGHMIHVPDGALCRCGNRGCIEAYASDYAIRRRACGASDDHEPAQIVTLKEFGDIIDSASAGDADAIAAFEDAGRAIGTGLASMFALMDPFPVVFVGTGGLARDHLEKPIRRWIGSHKSSPSNGQRSSSQASDIPIDFVVDSKELILRGALINALNRLDDEIANGEV